MSYSPPGYFQGDGSSYQWENCVLATSTDLIMRATVGATYVAASKLRTISGITVHRGVSYLEAENIVAKATGGRVQLAARYGLSRVQVRDLAAAGIAFGISIDTSVTRYTPQRTGTFIGGHTVYVQQLNSDGTYKVEDPGTGAGYLNWPADLLYRAAEKRGGGLINVLVGPDTEGVTRTGVSERFYASPYTSAAPGKAVVAGQKYPTYSTATGGAWKRADGGVSYGWYRVWGVGYVPGKGLR